MMDDNFNYVVDEETYNEFVRLLEEEPKDLPKLRKLMSSTSIWDEEV